MGTQYAILPQLLLPPRVFLRDERPLSLQRNVLGMPKLCEWRFSNFKIVRSDEVGLDFFALVRGVEVAPLGICKERVFGSSLGAKQIAEESRSEWPETTDWVSTKITRLIQITGHGEVTGQIQNYQIPYGILCNRRGCL
jgi:hypothetical protein